LFKALRRWGFPLLRGRWKWFYLFNVSFLKAFQFYNYPRLGIKGKIQHMRGTLGPGGPIFGLFLPKAPPGVLALANPFAASTDKYPAFWGLPKREAFEEFSKNFSN
jgi:hypothetical protein